MSAAGDLRTILTLDDYEFLTGLREASQETKKFAADVNQLGKSAGGGKAAAAIGQLAFAAQDFGSILSMGGKNALSRAVMSTMNNVQMLGAVCGPTGIAVTGLAGALGTALLPLLFEGKGAFDDIANSTRFATGQLEDFIRRTSEAIAFRAKLQDVDSGKQLGGMREDIDLQKKQAKATISALQEEHARIQRQIKSLDAQGEMGAEDPLSLQALLFPKATYTKHFEIGPQIEALQKQADTIHRQIGSKLAEMRELGARETLIEQKAPEVDFIDEQLEKEKEINSVLQKRGDLLDRLREKTATPAQKLNRQLRELRELFGESNGEMSVDDFDNISDMYFKEFRQSIHKQGGEGQKNAAAVAGTVQGFEAVAESIRAAETSPADAEQIEIGRQMLEQLREIVRRLASEGPDESVNGPNFMQGMGF